MIEKVGFDTAVDFSDNGHVNLAGAEKLTSYICEYLIENGYSYTDRRGQDGYELWDEGLKNYREYYKNGWSGKSVDVYD